MFCLGEPLFGVLKQHHKNLKKQMTQRGYNSLDVGGAESLNEKIKNLPEYLRRNTENSQM